jgi:hypothetical protein
MSIFLNIAALFNLLIVLWLFRPLIFKDHRQIDFYFSTIFGIILHLTCHLFVLYAVRNLN